MSRLLLGTSRHDRPAEAYPNLARVGSELLASGFVYAEEFEFGLDLILDAIGPVLPGA